MIKSSPRTLGQRFSLPLSAVALASVALLSACGGGGGGSDTASPTNPSGNPPDQVATSVKIVGAAGCEKEANADTCLVVATVTASKAASILVVGGVTTDVAPGTNIPVTLAAPGLGSKTVLMTAKDGSGSDQVVVTIGCKAGLTPDAGTGKCLAPVTTKMAFAIGGRWAIPAILDEVGYTEFRNDTGKVVINCMLPKTQTAPYTLIPGLCSDVSGASAEWLPVNYDPVAKNIITNPGGDVNPDNFVLASDQANLATGRAFERTVELGGVQTTFYVKGENGNTETFGGDVWKSVGGVETLIRDVNVSTGGSINHMTTFDVVVKK